MLKHPLPFELLAPVALSQGQRRPHRLLTVVLHALFLDVQMCDVSLSRAVPAAGANAKAGSRKLLPSGVWTVELPKSELLSAQ